MSPETDAGSGVRTVADLMRRKVVSIAPEASVYELAALLRRAGIHGVPVMKPGGVVVGFASASDLLWLLEPLLARGSDRAAAQAKETTVREVMTPDVFWVPPEASLKDLARFFQRSGVHHALVMEDDELVGVVSLTDLLAMVAERGEGSRS